MCVHFSAKTAMHTFFRNTSLFFGVLREELFQIVLQLNYAFDEIERFSIDEGNGNDNTTN